MSLDTLTLAAKSFDGDVEVWALPSMLRPPVCVINERFLNYKPRVIQKKGAAEATPFLSSPVSGLVLQKCRNVVGVAAAFS